MFDYSGAYQCSYVLRGIGGGRVFSITSLNGTFYALVSVQGVGWISCVCHQGDKTVHDSVPVAGISLLLSPQVTGHAIDGTSLTNGVTAIVQLGPLCSGLVQAIYNVPFVKMWVGSVSHLSGQGALVLKVFSSTGTRHMTSLSSRDRRAVGCTFTSPPRNLRCTISPHLTRRCVASLPRTGSSHHHSNSPSPLGTQVAFAGALTTPEVKGFLWVSFLRGTKWEVCIVIFPLFCFPRRFSGLLSS